MEKGNFKKKFIEFHDKNYKLLLLIPLAMLIFCFVYMGYFYSQNHDFTYRDVSLTGGTSITLNVIDKPFDVNNLKYAVSEKLGNINIREISDVFTGQQKAVVIEIRTETCDEYQINPIKNVLEDYLSYKLIDGENSGFECTGSILSQNFYKQLLIALLIAFVLMAIVVFIQFRSFVPSMAVIFSAFADIFMTLVVVNLLGIQISSAGIVAFLMLIGYSVDTDILLTTKAIKRDNGTLNRRLLESFKTGITMTLTSLVAVLVALIVVGSFSSILSQIFTIMIIGLSFDIFNTWLTNVSIIKWYALRKQKKHEA
jgi:preprotein translocase subunit SecF